MLQMSTNLLPFLSFTVDNYQLLPQTLGKCRRLNAMQQNTSKKDEYLETSWNRRRKTEGTPNT